MDVALATTLCAQLAKKSRDGYRASSAVPAIIKPFDGFIPQISEGVFLADGAVVVGHVTLNRGANVWYGAVVRGDCGPIVIGEGATIQDLVSIHMKKGGQAAEIGAHAAINHGALIHGAKIGAGVFVGNGAIIMDECEVGEQSVVAAGSLLPRGMKVPAGVLARGRPAQVIRKLSEEELSLGKREAKAAASLAEKSER